MKVLPVGRRGVLVELDDPDQRRALDAHLRHASVPGVVEHVTAARTVLVRVARERDIRQVIDRLHAVDLTAPPAAAASANLAIQVTYDGADLGHAAELLGISTDEVVRRHTSQVWTVEFVGFLPGFGYLSGAEGDLTVPRRDSPRARVPRGAVGLAGEWTGIYPSASPGGWQLIGTTEERLFDAERSPAALLTTGTRVRFRSAS
ncbi:5-oxoprolinase subunit B family protein [Luteipulveratus mongoliensis]|uniref:Allophanate hydrolase n=1 Tax=Luteipulveratus mongoliensis TaxID=571913 RepID=A0A0K1JM08_9MICO|nr:allophanate hydrolase subunit 1 [Luteipulveratus mongoliensis]AKU17741.1 allophanate hydrolase [Luteipulveratus mongoliensis]